MKNLKFINFFQIYEHFQICKHSLNSWFFYTICEYFSNMWIFFQNHDFLLIRELFLKFVNIFQIREKSNLIFLFVNFFQICDMVSTLWTFSDSDFFSKCRELFQMHELFLNSHFKILWTFFKFRKPTTDFFSEQYNNIRENRGKRANAKQCRRACVAASACELSAIGACPV